MDIMKWKEEGAQGISLLHDSDQGQSQVETCQQLGYLVRNSDLHIEVWCGRLFLLISKVVVGLDEDYMYVHACMLVACDI